MSAVDGWIKSDLYYKAFYNVSKCGVGEHFVLIDVIDSHFFEWKEEEMIFPDFELSHKNIAFKQHEWWDTAGARFE